jgi:hypothetical protein
MDVLKEKFSVNYALYLDQIDSTLLKELEYMISEDQKYRTKKLNKDEYDKLQKPIDSLNIQKLYKIVNVKGWPNRKQLGIGMIPDPTTIVIHSNHKDNIFFLNEVLVSAEKNLITWFKPEVIMSNLLWRFEKDEGLVKLRYLDFTRSGDLDLEKSYFQLATLAKFRKNNSKWKMTFFPTYTNSKDKNKIKNYKTILYKIKEFLVKEGVSEDLIILDMNFKKVKDDGLGKFYFGFTTEKI